MNTYPPPASADSTKSPKARGIDCDTGDRKLLLGDKGIAVERLKP
jgi:hypothetical protein